MELGDRLGAGTGWMGLYIGETLGRARSIVHFDPLLAASRNRLTAIWPGCASRLGGSADRRGRLDYGLHPGRAHPARHVDPP